MNALLLGPSTRLELRSESHHLEPSHPWIFREASSCSREGGRWLIELPVAMGVEVHTLFVEAVEQEGVWLPTGVGFWIATCTGTY